MSRPHVLARLHPDFPSHFVEIINITSMDLFVGNIGPAIRDEELRRIFGEYGELTRCDIVRKRSCAFVSYRSASSAAIAKKKLHRSGFLDCPQKMIVDFARAGPPRSDRSDRSDRRTRIVPPPRTSLRRREEERPQERIEETFNVDDIKDQMIRERDEKIRSLNSLVTQKDLEIEKLRKINSGNDDDIGSPLRNEDDDDLMLCENETCRQEKRKLRKRNSKFKRGINALIEQLPYDFFDGREDEGEDEDEEDEDGEKTRKRKRDNKDEIQSRIQKFSPVMKKRKLD